MGYTASGSGTMILRLPPCVLCGAYRTDDCKVQDFDAPLLWVQKTLKSVGFSKIECVTKLADGTIRMELEYSGNYREERISGALNLLSPYTISGKLSFRAGDGERWRFLFISGQWESQSGIIHYISKSVYPPFRQTNETLAALMELIQKRMENQEGSLEKRARTLLTAFEEADPDGVLCALTGCRLKDFLMELDTKVLKNDYAIK